MHTPPNVLPLEKVKFDDPPGIINPDMYSDFDTTKIIATRQQVEEFLTEIFKDTQQKNERVTQETPIPQSSLARIIFRLLAKDPKARYDSAYTVIQDFNALLPEPFLLETAEIRESYLQASSFVGRAAEQSLLTKALQKLDKNQGSAWLIGGESGVGKSRLIDEIRINAMVEGALVLVGQAVKGGGVPYQAWRSIMRRLCLMVDLTELEARVIKPLVPDIERLLEKEVDDPPELNSNETKARLITTITNIIKRYPDPLVLILEDLQWMRESLQIVTAVLEICDENALVIIGSFRDDERPNLPAELSKMKFIKLDRLTYNEIAELSEAMLGVLGTQDSILHLLKNETEGNVFFLVETVRALAEEAGQLSKIATLELPTTIFTRGIQDIIDHRLSGIAPQYQAILQLASIMGREINLPLLEYIVKQHATYEVNDINKWLDVCSSAAIIEVRVNDQTWRFTHDKIRQGIMDQIAETDRPQLHKQVALALEDTHEDVRDYAVTLAYHWRQAGNGHKEMEYMSLAGQSALDRGTFSDAGNHIKRALELYDILEIDDPYWHSDNLYRLAKNYLNEGAFEESLKACEQCMTMAQELDRKKFFLDTVYLRGMIAFRRGKIDVSQEYLHTALKLGRDLNVPEMTSRILMWLGATAIMQKDFTSADRYLEESLQLAQALDNYDAQLASILNTQGENLRYQQRFDEAIPHYEQSVDLFMKLGHFYALSAIPLNIAHANFARGNREVAINGYYEILENALDKKDKMVMLGCLAGLAHDKYNADNTTMAIQLIGLVMRHPSTSAETKVLIQPLIDDLPSKIDKLTYDHAYDELGIESLENVAKYILQRN